MFHFGRPAGSEDDSCNNMRIVAIVVEVDCCKPPEHAYSPTGGRRRLGKSLVIREQFKALLLLNSFGFPYKINGIAAARMCT